MAIVQNVLVHAAELWTISDKKNEREILATDMECLRRCCGSTRRGKLREEDIRRKRGIEADILKTYEKETGMVRSG